MFRNYLIVTLRSISRNILFVSVNIITLALALAICIVAYLNGKYDRDWDKYHVNAEEIYKINFIRDIQGRQQPYGACPIPVAGLIGESFTGVEEVVRYMASRSPLKVGLDNFNKRIAYVDPAFLDIFTVPLLKGSREDFKNRQNIFISEETASIYFGDEDPIGQVMSIFNDDGKEFTYTVAGVYEKNPLNTSMRYDVLSHAENFIDMWDLQTNNWENWIPAIFLHIPNAGQVGPITQLLQDFVPLNNAAREDFQITGFRLQPLLDVGHDSWDMYSDWWVWNSFHPAAVAAPPIMALLILLIACFNITNSSIAISSRRLKEIGVRKVAGGHRKNIIIQFMTENFILTFLGLLLSLLLAGWLTDVYSRMWDYMELDFSLVDNPPLILFLVALLLVTTLFAGAYPSFYISRFNPVYIFQDKLKIGGRNVLTVILLTLQISISVMAINSGVIYTQNANFQDNIYLGYDKDHIIGMRLPGEEYFLAFRDLVKTNPLIQQVGESRHHIGHGNWSRVLKYGDIEEEVGFITIGDEYFETMGLSLKEGRTFTRENSQTDSHRSLIVNEKFVEEFGMENPLGERLMMEDTVPLYIIGVVSDFYVYGVWDEVEPGAFMRDNSRRLNYLAIKTDVEHLQEVNQWLEEKWKELIPSHPYGGFFQDSLMEDGRLINKNIKNMYTFLALIALFLSAIGLYTLVSLSVIRRTKEVGVRKVLGSSIAKIIAILSRPYFIIIFISSAIGLAAGYYSSMGMMKSIWEVYTDSNLFTFLIPILLIILVAFISIGWKVWYAASRNPTESLRYE
jgi:ABC-type antimicrobial peptide transport system permease subunit